ncbi:hypothetical protein BIW11_09623 [Tropilaelaps mercedesae]|uniref:CSD domain-containing protein n=1 Tax=Tropilaelaps mercedesae TaxID=418985 RepID=A0A1V9XJ93_9ACAR|nr:hypothetical protein BIW11_09623 [Tropilaelaps mercedesae]
MSAEHGGGGDSAIDTPADSESVGCLPEDQAPNEDVNDAQQREDQAISTAKEMRQVQRISSDLRGVVRWYNSRLCYGFIEREDTKCELFVHRNSVVMAPGEPVFLQAESEVLFDLWTLPDGRLEAQTVRTASGEPISLRGIRPVCPPRGPYYGYHSRSHDIFSQSNIYG